MVAADAGEPPSLVRSRPRVTPLRQRIAQRTNHRPPQPLADRRVPCPLTTTAGGEILSALRAATPAPTEADIGRRRSAPSASPGALIEQRPW